MMFNISNPAVSAVGYQKTIPKIKNTFSGPPHSWLSTGKIIISAGEIPSSVDDF
jgi:hypothetical protein